MENKQHPLQTRLQICVLVVLLTESSSRQMNVLFIVSDDLRPALSSYGDAIVQTPNLDKLAKRSVRFSTASSQLAVCAPSRTSFLTGRRPDTTKLFSNKNATYWRDNAGNFTSLPQHFKKAGYLTVSVGKIFHPGTYLSQEISKKLLSFLSFLSCEKIVLCVAFRFGFKARLERT